jgi:type I site-specific restriction endonuclease
MTFNEADTRAKLIDPAIHKRGWTEDLIRREESMGEVEIINGKPRRRGRGKIDYVLRVKVISIHNLSPRLSSMPRGGWSPKRWLCCEGR